jgi:hypothetical protein
MRLNNSGKIIPIFSIIIAVLLLTLTAVSIFYTKQEKEKRKALCLYRIVFFCFRGVSFCFVSF